MSGKVFTESIEEVPPRARVTGRLRRHAARVIGTGQPVAATVARLPISWRVGHDAFVAHADRLLAEPAAPAVLGIDETRRGRPRWSRDPGGGWRKLERFETNFVDLTGDGGLLGQTAGRTGAAVVAWLDARGQAWKDAVQVVAMDPCVGYRAAVAQALPHARIVVDHFHLVRLANQMLTEVRQRVARDQLGRRGRRSDLAELVKLSVCESASGSSASVISFMSTGSSQAGQGPPGPSRRVKRLQSGQRRSVSRSPHSPHS